MWELISYDPARHASQLPQERILPEISKASMQLLMTWLEDCSNQDKLRFAEETNNFKFSMA